MWRGTAEIVTTLVCLTPSCHLAWDASEYPSSLLIGHAPSVPTVAVAHQPEDSGATAATAYPPHFSTEALPKVVAAQIDFSGKKAPSPPRGYPSRPLSGSDHAAGGVWEGSMPLHELTPKEEVAYWLHRYVLSDNERLLSDTSQRLVRLADDLAVAGLYDLAGYAVGHPRQSAKDRYALCCEVAAVAALNGDFPEAKAFRDQAMSMAAANPDLPAYRVESWGALVGDYESLGQRRADGPGMTGSSLTSAPKRLKDPFGVSFDRRAPSGPAQVRAALAMVQFAYEAYAGAVGKQETKWRGIREDMLEYLVSTAAEAANRETMDWAIAELKRFHPTRHGDRAFGEANARLFVELCARGGTEEAARVLVDYDQRYASGLAAVLRRADVYDGFYTTDPYIQRFGPEVLLARSEAAYGNAAAGVQRFDRLTEEGRGLGDIGTSTRERYAEELLVWFLPLAVSQGDRATEGLLLQRLAQASQRGTMEFSILSYAAAARAYLERGRAAELLELFGGFIPESLRDARSRSSVGLERMREIQAVVEAFEQGDLDATKDRIAVVWDDDRRRSSRGNRTMAESRASQLLLGLRDSELIEWYLREFAATDADEPWSGFAATMQAEPDSVATKGILDACRARHADAQRTSRYVRLKGSF